MSKQFIVTLAVLVGLVIAGALGYNQVLLQKQINGVQEQINYKVQAVKVSPTAMPSPTVAVASPTATLKVIRPVVTVVPTK